MGIDPGDGDIKHGSLAMMYSLEARGERQQPDQPSNMSAVYRKGYFNILVSKMKEFDPEGRKAHALAAKYRR